MVQFEGGNSKSVERVDQLKDPEQFRQRFNAMVDSSGGPDACWPFKGRKNEFGYGRVDIKHASGGGSVYLAHRVAYMLEHGAMPPRPLVVRHTCIDSRSCCNPAHLIAGTQAENMQDRQRQGRTASKSGERNPRALVTAREVVLIRAAYAAGEKQRAIGERYGITESTVGLIVLGKRWKDVPMPGDLGWEEALELALQSNAEAAA